MQIKNQLIVLSNNGTILHTEKHDIKQFENNFEFLILCNVFQGTTKGTISLSFSDEYPLQYATLRKEPYTYNGVEYDVYGWRGIQDLTLDAPRTISLSILADDYNNNIFSTLPITYNCIQSLQYNEVVGEPNSVESISFELNNAIAEIQNISGNIDGIFNGDIVVDSANKDSQGNIIHETYATIETVSGLDERVTVNENDIADLKNEQVEQNERLDVIEPEQETQNTKIENNRWNIGLNKNNINTNSEKIDVLLQLVIDNRDNAESRIPKDLTDYNFKPTLQDNDVILIKQNDGNFKRILAKDLITQLGTQTDLYKGQFISMEALISAYPEGENHGFVTGTYATIDTVGKDTFNAIWDTTDLKWVAADTSGFVSNVIYLLEQQEQNTKINDLKADASELKVDVIQNEIKIDGHIQDLVRHITSAERANWNDQPSNATFNSHVNDSVKHITEVERTKWNSFTNYDDTAIKANIASNTSAINTHIVDADKHITPAERTAWNAKVDEATVDSKIAALVDTAPDALNSLNELAAALGDDPNFATTVTNNLGKKVDKVVGSSLVEDTKVASYDSHIVDTTKHITNAERTSWNAKLDGTDITTSLLVTDTSKVASAYNTAILQLNKVGYADIADNLTTTDNNTVLSAKQGNELDKKIKELNDKIESSKTITYEINKQFYSGDGFTENQGPTIATGLTLDFEKYYYEVDFFVYETGWSSSFCTLTFAQNNQRVNKVMNFGVTTPTYTAGRTFTFSVVLTNNGELKLYFLSTNYPKAIDIIKIRAVPYGKVNLK